MAMFSAGGFTSPDIWIVISILLIASVSLLLNPLVIRHNIRKKRSLARDLYVTLSTTDLITCLLFPVVLSIRIMQPKDEQCEQDPDYGADFCRTDYFMYKRVATMTEKAVGCVTWYLVLSTPTITAVLAISRWYQISYPLRVLNRTAVETILAALCSFQAIYYSLTLFCDSPKRPTEMIINIQTVWNDFPLFADFVTVEHVGAILQSTLSIIASVLTMFKVVNSQAVPRNTEIRARRIRSTIKITLLNTGNVADLTALIILAVMSSDLAGLPEMKQLILESVTVCFLPVILSTYNPIIYTVLTRGVFNSPVGGGN